MGPLPPDSGPDGAGPAPSVRPGGERFAELLVEAIRLYQHSEFEQARHLLETLLVEKRGLPSPTVRDAYLYLGFVQIAFGDNEAALASFEQALELDLEVSVPRVSPKIEALLAQARQRVRQRRRAMDHDPPTLDHRAVARGRYGVPILVRVEARDQTGIKRVVLNYRQAGGRGFSTVTMERETSGAFVATIPGLVVARPGLEYFLEAWDELNNGPGLKGSSQAPIRITVEGGPLAQRAAEPRWYERWYVWAGLAGVVAAAGAVAATVYLTREETARLDVRVPQELDP